MYGPESDEPSLTEQFTLSDRPRKGDDDTLSNISALDEDVVAPVPPAVQPAPGKASTGGKASSGGKAPPAKTNKTPAIIQPTPKTSDKKSTVPTDKKGTFKGISSIFTTSGNAYTLQETPATVGKSFIPPGSKGGIRKSSLNPKKPSSSAKAPKNLSPIPAIEPICDQDYPVLVIDSSDDEINEYRQHFPPLATATNSSVSEGCTIRGLLKNCQNEDAHEFVRTYLTVLFRVILFIPLTGVSALKIVIEELIVPCLKMVFDSLLLQIFALIIKMTENIGEVFNQLLYTHIVRCIHAFQPIRHYHNGLGDFGENSSVELGKSGYEQRLGNRAAELEEVVIAP